eukprot:jgi/Mesen1/6726/ME000344S06013
MATSSTVRKLFNIVTICLLVYISFSVGVIQVLRDRVVTLPFNSSDEILADFYDVGAGGKEFLFGLATAPAHVEDQLDDTWLDFARLGADSSSSKKPPDRLRFWSDPETELRMTSATGVQSFRLGIDWGRLVPREPFQGTKHVVDREAVRRYREILESVRAHKMRVMLTLFHHSIPKLAKEEFGDLVDQWVTFNEPHIFVILTHCAGAWPPGKSPSFLQSLVCMLPWGAFGRAMDGIARAHIAAYDEFISMVGLQLVPGEEYSEAGRAVYPDGLYEVLVASHKRYRTRFPRLRYIITENGIADDKDVIRRPYLLEHLLALHAAIKQGVPVDGYYFWTLADNWEWADGYCPKFGLVDVDRANNLTRTPRPSYHLFSEVVKTGKITRQQREEQWELLQEEVARGGTRPFCREADYAGRMWADALDSPYERPIASKDWRFGEYKVPDITLSTQRSLQAFKIAAEDLFRLLTGQSIDAGATPLAEKLTGAQEL